MTSILKNRGTEMPMNGRERVLRAIEYRSDGGRIPFSISPHYHPGEIRRTASADD